MLLARQQAPPPKRHRQEARQRCTRPATRLRWQPAASLRAAIWRGLSDQYQQAGAVQHGGKWMGRKKTWRILCPMHPSSALLRRGLGTCLQQASVQAAQPQGVQPEDAMQRHAGWAAQRALVPLGGLLPAFREGRWRHAIETRKKKRPDKCMRASGSHGRAETFLDGWLATADCAFAGWVFLRLSSARFARLRTSLC